MFTRNALKQGLALAAILSATPALADDYAIHAGRMIDGHTQKVRTNVTIIVDDDRIAAIEDGFTTPEGFEVIDLSSSTVLPGMFDVHSHVTGGLRSRNRMAVLPERIAIQTAANMRAILMSGFTYVRDVSGNIDVLKATQESINAGIIPGPRMKFTGYSLTPTGGPADFSKAMDPNWVRLDGADTSNIVNSPDEAIKAVRERRQRGAEAIKINASGGVASTGVDVNRQVLAEDELEAIVDTAHSLNMTVAAHAHGHTGIRASLLAGVDSIEHGTYSDEGDYKIMKEKGVYMVPTLYAANEIREQAINNPDNFPPDVRDKAINVTPQMSGNLTRAYRYGVKIALGTDQLGYKPLGDSAMEFVYMTEAGMTPMDAIIAATGNAADLLGADDLGRLETGKLADIVAVASDPLTDITELQRVRFVMKGGHVYKTGGAPVIED
jgi:imidazolonepropionase-like amidohydrolase